MNAFDNWRTCALSPGFLRREDGSWFDPLGAPVVTLTKPVLPSQHQTWTLIAYKAAGFTGDLKYALYAFSGNNSVGTLGGQLATVLKLGLPEGVDFDIAAFGSIDFEDSGEGSIIVFVDDLEIAELWVEPDGSYGWESVLLDDSSLDYLYTVVRSITDVNNRENSHPY